MKITKHTFNVADELSFDVRAILRDGEPWFVAKDVAAALGYSNTADAVGKHCKRVSDIAIHDVSSKQRRNVKIIPESDLYRLAMRSRLESAEQFTDWVAEVVLPSIRKNGAYVYGQESLPEALQSDLAAAAVEALKVMENRIAIVCGAKHYSKDDQAKIAVAYRAAEAIMQAKGLDVFPYDSFAEQLVLLKVPHLKAFETSAMAKVNDAFKIDLYRKKLEKKHQHSFSSW